MAQTLLLTRVAKTTSTWRLSALPTAQEVSDQHFKNSSYSPFEIDICCGKHHQTACQAAPLKPVIRIFDRTIKIDVLTDEMTLEADTKLVENALESMKMNSAKGVDSPRVRRNEEQTAQIENSEKLTSVESTLYRSLVMKLAYVAQDRIDIAEAVKCLTRHMKEPRTGHMEELKRLGRRTRDAC